MVQLASETRGILLGALALKDVMKELSQPSFIDSLVRKVFHGRVSRIAWLSYTTTKQTSRAMNNATRCPARSNQLSAAAKQQPAENNKQRESDDSDDGGDGNTKQNGRTIRKQSEHSLSLIHI